jgi:hypothetical protein
METFYETYKFLLLELSYDETVKRMDDPKFKRLITGSNSIEEMSPLNKHAYGALRSTIIKSIPNDISEKDKANALNWMITRILKDNPIYPENRFFLRPKSVAHQLNGGPDLLKRQLEFFYQIKKQNMGRLLPKNEIERYSSFKEFVEAVEEALPAYREYLTQKQEKSTKGEGQLLVYEDANWQVYFPQTKGAACALGKDTDWCTAAPGLDYYNEYSQDGQLIIFISKKDPSIKYQLHYPSGHFMDENDIYIGSKFFILNKILKDNIIGSEFEKYLSKEERERILDIDEEESTKFDNYSMIDDNYALIKYSEDDGFMSGGSLYVEEVINVGTLISENPYSPTHTIKKQFLDEDRGPLYNVKIDDAAYVAYYYFIDEDHPDNPYEINQLTIHYTFKSGKEKADKYTVSKRDIVYEYLPENVPDFSKYMTLGVK